MNDLKIMHEVKDKNSYLVKKVEKQNRYIRATKKQLGLLKESSHLLELQLTLMDERYMDVKNALNAAKKFQNTVVKNASEEGHQLRMKYAQSTGRILDEIQLPSSPLPRSGASTPTSQAKRLSSRPSPGTSRPNSARAGYLPVPESASHQTQSSHKASFPHGEHSHTRRAAELERILTKIEVNSPKKNPTDPIWSKERLDKLLEPVNSR
jgi:hypothetical protein